MIDKKHFKIRERTMFRGYHINIRRGSELWLAEILDKNDNYVAKTRFCGNRTEAANEAASIINRLAEGDKNK